MSIGPTYYDYVRITAAANGTMPAVNPADELNSTLAGAAILGTGGAMLQGGFWLWGNHGNYSEAWKLAKQNAVNARTPELLKQKGNLFTNPFTNKYYWQGLRECEGKIFQQPKPLNYSELMKIESDKEREFIRSKNNYAFMKARHYVNARNKLVEIKKMASQGKLHGRELKQALKEVRMLINQAELDVLNDKNLKPIGKWAKTCNFVNKYTGINAAKRACLKGTLNKSSATARVAGKAGLGFIRHGGPITLAIEMGLEIPEVLKTYSELGAGKGTKQLGKSAFVAGASAVGFAAGAKVGAILGAKIGTAIGACFGGVGAPIGAAIGSIVGIGCGVLASWGTRYLAKKMTGESELEKAKKSSDSNIAFNIARDKNKQLELCSDLYIKAQNKEIALDGDTIASMERLLAGKEAEFEQMVKQKHEAQKLDVAA